jgi:hypothetical protein
MKAKVFDRPEVNETTATISPNGQFTIDESIDLKHNSRVNSTTTKSTKKP